MGMEFFEDQWASYRAIVDHDLMDHRAISAAVAAELEAWLAEHLLAEPMASPPVMVDLGCGDLGLLAPLLRRLPLGSYTGLDLTPGVLPLARAALGPVPYPTHWQAGDLLSWAADGAEAQGPIDILHSSFAIHHLTDDEKASFLQQARQRLSPTGLFLWADVFCRPGEPRDVYIARYSARIRDQWAPLSDTQKEQAIHHLSLLDQPADRTAIQRVAEEAGWRWRWLWQGEHDSEALAVLTPASTASGPTRSSNDSLL